MKECKSLRKMGSIKNGQEKIVNLYNCVQYIYASAAILFLFFLYTFLAYGVSIFLGALVSMGLSLNSVCYLQEPTEDDTTHSTYDISSIDLFLGCPIIGFLTLCVFAVLLCFMFFTPSLICFACLHCCGIKVVYSEEEHSSSKSDSETKNLTAEVLDKPRSTELDMRVWDQVSAVPVVIPYVPSAPTYTSIHDESEA